jgi:hypothetical protein
VYDWDMYGGHPDFIGDCTATQEELVEGEGCTTRTSSCEPVTDQDCGEGLGHGRI